MCANASTKSESANSRKHHFCLLCSHFCRFGSETLQASINGFECSSVLPKTIYECAVNFPNLGKYSNRYLVTHRVAVSRNALPDITLFLVAANFISVRNPIAYLPSLPECTVVFHYRAKALFEIMDSITGSLFCFYLPIGCL